MSFSGSAGSPTVSRRAFATTFASTASYTPATRIARERAEHFCPWKPNAEVTMAFAAASTSAVSSTMIESLPPISRMVRLIHFWPGRGLAASSLMRRPTSREPVNETKRVRGCSTSASPTMPPGPGRKFTTPSGRPVSCRRSTKRAATSAEVLAGLSTMVVPATVAGALGRRGVLPGAEALPCRLNGVVRVLHVRLGEMSQCLFWLRRIERREGVGFAAPLRADDERIRLAELGLHLAQRLTLRPHVFWRAEVGERRVRERGERRQ